MNIDKFIIYSLLKTYNQTSRLDSIYKTFNNQFTFYDFKKELFDESVNHFVPDPLYREFLKAYVR